MTEKEALGRVLMISKEAYRAYVKEMPGVNIVALLDSLSAALSHCGTQQPLGKLMGKLSREIKGHNRAFYFTVKRYFSRLCPVVDYDYEKALKHIPAIIFGNDKICAKVVSGENDRAKSMSDAMKSYPGFLFGEFGSLTDKQFYDLVFGYYPTIYDEAFLDEKKSLFEQ